jgi:hypothetical protein
MIARMDRGIGSAAGAVKLALAIAGGLLIAACGRVGDLRPPPGGSLPVKPKLARTVPAAENLLARPPYARPQRVDELQSRNVPRESDRFDLPPPAGGRAPPAETEGQPEQQVDDPGPATRNDQ